MIKDVRVEDLLEGKNLLEGKMIKRKSIEWVDTGSKLFILANVLAMSFLEQWEWFSGLEFFIVMWLLVLGACLGPVEETVIGLVNICRFFILHSCGRMDTPCDFRSDLSLYKKWYGLFHVFFLYLSLMSYTIAGVYAIFETPVQEKSKTANL